MKRLTLLVLGCLLAFSLVAQTKPKARSPWAPITGGGDDKMAQVDLQTALAQRESQAAPAKVADTKTASKPAPAAPEFTPIEIKEAEMLIESAKALEDRLVELGKNPAVVQYLEAMRVYQGEQQKQARFVTAAAAARGLTPDKAEVDIAGRKITAKVDAPAPKPDTAKK